MTVQFNDDVQIRLRIGFASDPTVSLASTIWTDVTADLRAPWMTKRGKQHEIGKFEAGTAEFVLDNRSGNYDPTNSAGAHFPNVKIDRRVSFQAIHNSITHDIYHGFIKSYRQVYNTKMANEGYAVTIIECVDSFSNLARTKLLDSPYATEVQKTIDALALNDVLWYRLAEDETQDVAVNSGPGATQFDGAYVGSNRKKEAAVYLSDNPSVEFVQRDDANVIPSDQVNIPQVILDYPFTIEMVIKIPGDGVAGNENDITPLLGTFDTDPSFGSDPGQFVMLNTVGELVSLISDGPNERRITAVSSAGTAETPLDDGFETMQAPIGNAPGPNKAHHITVRYSSATNHEIWIDGVQRTGSIFTRGNDAPVITTDKPWVIGPGYNVPSGGDPRAPYIIDEVVIYPNTALDPATIVEHGLAAIDTRLFTYDAFGGIFSTGTRNDVAWGEDTPGERVSRILDIAKIPASDRVISSGSVNLQPTTLGGNALEYLQKVEETEFGAFYQSASGLLTFLDRDDLFGATPRHSTVQATYGDGAGEFDYVELAEPTVDDTQILNDSTVGRARGPERHAEDATSLDEHHRGKHTATDLLHNNDLTSDDYANFIVSNFAQPLERVESITVDIQAPGELTTTIPDRVLAREVLDKVQVNRRPPHGQLKEIVAVVLQLEHRSAGPKKWTTTYQLTPVGAVADGFWQLGIGGNSELGTSTVLGF